MHVARTWHKAGQGWVLMKVWKKVYGHWWVLWRQRDILLLLCTSESYPGHEHEREGFWRNHLHEKVVCISQEGSVNVGMTYEWVSEWVSERASKRVSEKTISGMEWCALSLASRVSCCNSIATITTAKKDDLLASHLTSLGLALQKFVPCFHTPL